MDELALKQNVHRYVLVMFGFDILKLSKFNFIQIYSFKCLETILWASNIFNSLSKNYFTALLSFLLSHVKLLKVSLALLAP